MASIPIDMVTKAYSPLGRRLSTTIQYSLPGSSCYWSNICRLLGLIAEGYTNPEIAEKLFVSQFTVDSHRKNLITKLNVKNTAMLIRFTVEHKLI
jgi:DNA-binding CsgD family transcriptional regulator